MTRRATSYVLVAGLLCVGLSLVPFAVLSGNAPTPEGIWAAYRADRKYGAVQITDPIEDAVFPPEIVAPTFRWKDEQAEADTWLVRIGFEDNEGAPGFLSDREQWTPSDDQWRTIQRRSRGTPARVSIVGVRRAAPGTILSAGHVTIRTSKDEVGAPLFYREVNLPFREAVKDPGKHIRWRFGDVASKKPPAVVLENLPVCANCHSFSASGEILGMDVDYANDKGSYAILPVAEEMTLSNDRIISWNDYKREDGQFTYGLLSQVSPDGKHVVSTVKDRSVFVARPGLEFSQLFFPIRGILAVYSRETGAFHALPGADDPRFVQTNPTWSPDGKFIVFARSKAHPLKTRGNNVLLTEEECREFLEEGKTFLFDLYRIPFNGGKGGTPEPIRGASNNGASNYFARFSPDGRWIVFCKARSYMLLQPGSELYIMPAAGGEARRMRCNTSRMNSWHSWSPNGKWLVFSSKQNGPYTQLFLAHIDPQGRSSPPVVLSNFTAPDRAANIPEFVNVEAGAIRRIRQQFIDDHSFVRAGNEFFKAGDPEGAVRSYRKAIEMNPRNADAHAQLALTRQAQGKLSQAVGHYRKALSIDPGLSYVHYNLGLIRCRQRRVAEGIAHYTKAIEIEPEYAAAHLNLGIALRRQGKLDRAIEHYRKAVAIDPENARAHNNLGNALRQQGKLDRAIEHYIRAIEIDPGYDKARENLRNARRQRGLKGGRN
jgi:tetratricopeptide (TPR) repeat protein